MKPTVLIISCEHAVNTVPEEYLELFHKKESVLKSRFAYDYGALDITQHLHEKLNSPYVASTVTRLLIDCNRSLTHSRCFSKHTRSSTKAIQQALINSHYLPFQQQVQEFIKSEIALNHQVLHLSVHTFAPTRHGLPRRAGLGMIYDSRRHGEKEVARLWHTLLLQYTPVYRIRMNFPYLGKNNFMSTLRHQYTEHDYLGLELQCNQALLHKEASRHQVKRVIASSLQELLEML